jgi:hypothetical protein
MDWKLVLQLSLFGLLMGVATVFVIPSNIEPLFWLAVFIVCSILIARKLSNRHFLHGLATGIANSVWITSAHVILFHQYAARHAKEMAMVQSMAMPDSPRLMMAIMGVMAGIVSGIVLGLFALIAGKLVRQMPRNAAV